MRKLNIFIANTFFLLHCLLCVFLLVGWFFPQIKLLYLAVLIVWFGCWVFLGYCPITKWEFSLRRKYNKNIDPNAEAIKYYMYKFFKVDVSANAIFIGGLIVFIILIILTIIY
jgi:hypothetical protein